MVVVKQVQGEESQEEENEDLLSIYTAPGLILISSFLTFAKFINFLLTILLSILSQTFFQGLSIPWPSYTSSKPIL